ncbi:MAG: extracellular solute-binding protein [Chloroflexi bacterium]|nr:extracellular solute-binding protein [Chloroflexota bacterium]MCI0579933.1 extracellular solute-binding protein [Chloroflexota bacterium]MCI0646516.1 extracellular solute-binding protein [Chloroflexota bacterium]MCI0726132.1 extracellular solute-binding protein [Chloroflexota bacterium]
MTQEIEFWIMEGSPEASLVADLRSLLNQFEAESHVHVRPRYLSWETGWSQLVKVALYGDGPDVSEIGSTWLGDLVSMHELRPFSAQEIALLGGAAAFLPSAWQGGTLGGEQETWAIPWLAGARLVHYRRNLLHQAGLDEQTAFSSIAQFEQTARRLQESGVAAPWAVPTDPSHATLLNGASWVWGAGGDFLAPNGRRTLFNEPAARAGLRAYFALGRYLLPEVHHAGSETDTLFLANDQAAMTLSGPWLYDQAQRQGGSLAGQVSVALPPGPAFVGGSHLVVWNYTRQPEAALQLIRFLTRPDIQVLYSQRIGLLPARLDAWREPPFATDPIWRTAIEGLKSGRSFPVTPRWGLIEDRLVTELSYVWSDILANPNQNLDAIIAGRLGPLAQRLDLTLSQR